jgi:hypothetical protein
MSQQVLAVPENSKYFCIYFSNKSEFSDSLHYIILRYIKSVLGLEGIK